METQTDRYLISLDKASFDREWLVRFVERLRVEELANQLNLGEEIEELGEQIKADWWAKNKAASFMTKKAVVVDTNVVFQRPAPQTVRYS